MPEPSTASRIVRNTGWLYAKMGITVFISLWTTRIILNSLGESDFGIYNLVGGAVAMLGFFNAAMAASTQRFMNYAEGEGDEDKLKSIFNVSVVLHICVASAYVILMVLMGLFLFNGFLNIPAGRESASLIVYISLIVSTVFSVIAVPYEAVLNAHENMKYYAVVGVLESFLKLMVAFLTMTAVYDRLMLYAVLMACIPVFTRFIMSVYCKKHYAECIFSPFVWCRRTLFREMAAFSGWNLLGTSSSMFCNYGSGIVLNVNFGTTVNAAHGIANQLNGQIMAFSNNMLKAVNPIVAKSEGAGDRGKMLRATFTGSKMSFFILTVLAVPVIIEMPYLLRLWLKTVPDWACVFTQLFLIRSCIEQMTALFVTSISAEGHIKGLQISYSAFSAISLILAAILFALGYPPVWLYISFLFFYVICYSASKVIIMHRNCGMEYSSFFKSMFWPMVTVSLVSVAAGLIPHALMPEGFLRLLVVFAVSVPSFVLTAYYVGLDRTEKVVFSDIVRSTIARFNKKI